MMTKQQPLQYSHTIIAYRIHIPKFPLLICYCTVSDDNRWNRPPGPYKIIHICHMGKRKIQQISNYRPKQGRQPDINLKRRLIYVILLLKFVECQNPFFPIKLTVIVVGNNDYTK